MTIDSYESQKTTRIDLILPPEYLFTNQLKAIFIHSLYALRKILGGR